MGVTRIGGGGSSGGTGGTPQTMTKAQIDALLFGGMPEGALLQVRAGQLVDSGTRIEADSHDMIVEGELRTGDNVLQLGDDFVMYDAHGGVGYRLPNGRESMAVLVDYDANGTGRPYYPKLGAQVFVPLNSSYDMTISQYIDFSYTTTLELLVWDMFVWPLTAGTLHVTIYEDALTTGDVLYQHYIDVKTSDLNAPMSLGVHSPWISKPNKTLYAVFQGIDLAGGVAQAGDKMVGINGIYLDFIAHPHSKAYIDELLLPPQPAEMSVDFTVVNNGTYIVDSTNNTVSVTASSDPSILTFTIIVKTAAVHNGHISVLVGKDGLTLNEDNSNNTYVFIRSGAVFNVYENGVYKEYLEI